MTAFDQPIPTTAAAASPRPGIGMAFRVSCGNFLEMYDFMVFGYYAIAIGHAFFPAGDAFASLMLAFMTFGAGFLMRPLGALVLGTYVDRIGLRKGLILTLGLMAVGTLVLACMPGYRTLGLLAPSIVLLGRLLQGFSAGVELGSTSIYLSAMAGEGRKGFYVAFQSMSQQIAVVFAAALGVVLTYWLSPQTMAAWGWRVPLLIGCAIVPFLFVLRRSLLDIDHGGHKAGEPVLSFGERLRVLGGAWRTVAVGMMLVIMTTTSFYLITAYTPSFGRTALHLSSMDSLVVTFCIGLSNFIWLPLAGALSDRIGRRPILFACTILAVATAYPIMLWLASSPSFTHLLLTELWLSFLYGSYNGAMVVFLTEYVPARVRNAGFSLAYSLATCIGGFSPAICTWLIHATGNAAMPGAWLTLAAACGLAATILSRR